MIQCLCFLLEPFFLAQQALEGERYITSSLAIGMCEGLRASINETLSKLNEGDAPKGYKIVKDVQSAFEARFGDGTHITEMKEGFLRQPCG